MATTTQPASIFISYARRNQVIVNALERTLQAWGMRPWIDRQKLIGGQEWANEIYQAINNCQLFLLVLTPQALRGEFVRREYLHALSQHKRVILLCYKAVNTASLPIELRALPQIDLTQNREAGLFHLLYTIQGLWLRAPQPPGTFDGALALAMTYEGHIPANWRVYRAAPSSYMPLAIIFGVLTLLAVVATLLFTLHILVGVGLAESSILDDFIFGALVGLVILLGRRSYIFTMLWLGRYMPEAIVIAPDGIVMRRTNIFWPVFFRNVQTSFSRVQDLKAEPVWQAMPGTYGLRIAEKNPVAGPGRYMLPLPLRIGDSRTIAMQIAALWQQLPKTNAVVMAPNWGAPPPMPAPVPAPSRPQINAAPRASMSSAPVVAPPFAPAATPSGPPTPPPSTGKPTIVCVCYVGNNQRFLRRLQGDLTERAVTLIDTGQIAQNPAQFQQAIEQCAAVILILSPAAIHSQEILQQYTYALSRGKHIIPIIAQQVSTIPTHFASLQWIDLSHEASRDKGLYDLLLALANAGIPSPAGAFDGQLALARAMHNLLPDNAACYTIPNLVYRRQLRQRTWSLVQTAIYIPLLLIIAIVLVALLPFLISFGNQGSLFVAIFWLALGVALLSFLLAWNINQWRMYRRLYRGQPAPEMIAITPEGWANRTRVPWRNSFHVHSYPYNTFDEITFSKGVFGTYTVTMKRRDGKTVGKEKISNFYGTVPGTGMIAERLRDAFQSYRNRAGWR